MKILIILLAWLTALPGQVTGLRNLKIGDKLPATEALRFTITDKPKLILCLNSSRDRNVSFFKELVSVIEDKKNITLFLADTNLELDTKIASVYESLQIEKLYVPDTERKIFGDLGIIVLPTLLFVTKDNILHSFTAGYRSNLKLVFKSHIEAFIKGVQPESIAQKAEETMDERQISRLIEQGFRLIVSRNFELAHNSFEKALDIDPENENANLGLGYTLMFQNKLEESQAHFSTLREKKENNRVLLGFHLSMAMQDTSEEDLSKIAALSLLEPRFFYAIFQAGLILDKAGKNEESKLVYKHAYEVLLRIYRRNL